MNPFQKAHTSSVDNAKAEALSKPPTLALDDERIVPGLTDPGTLHAHVARYEFALRWLTGNDHVLETACGAGYGTQLIASRSRHVVATDYSPIALEHARKHFFAPNVTFNLMDCNHWTAPPESFDCIVSFEVLEHLPDQVAYLQNCLQSLRAGGMLLLSTPNRTTAQIHMRSIQQVNEFHIGELDLAGLRKLLGRVFPSFTIYGQRRRGSALYTAMRALDIWNLRLRFIPSTRRENMQEHFGVPRGHKAVPAAWVFTRSQLRQANGFFAVCHKT